MCNKKCLTKNLKKTDFQNQLNIYKQTKHSKVTYSCMVYIADRSRSFELVFTAFERGSEKFLTAKENFDLKENRKLK